MRTRQVVVVVTAAVFAACSSPTRRGGGPGGDGADANPGAGGDGNCVATLAGTVFAPNGTLPLYGVSVYVPGTDPGPIPSGLTCSKCSDGLPGNPVVQTTTGTDGRFELPGVPAGSDVPVVITTGKWRRQIVVPTVAKCGPTTILKPDTTLPKSGDDLTPNTTSVDMPKIAISTGAVDQLECLVRRLGVADKEFTTAGEAGHVHLYSDNQSGGPGVAQFGSGVDGGKSFADSETLWGMGSNDGQLDDYDLVLLDCEGDQFPETKPQAAMDHMKAYADAGGRLFMTHWMNVWLEGSTEDATKTQKPAVWPTIATFDDEENDPDDPSTDTIDETHNPKGSAFASWMVDPSVMGSSTRDAVVVNQPRASSKAVDNTKAERWVNLVTPTALQPQMFQFTTPNEVSSDQRCGKVVFSDMHVHENDSIDTTFPETCSDEVDLSPQEKALAFMFFDITSCVGQIE